MKAKLLAITPYFQKSGSEIALLNLLDAIKDKFKITIYTKNAEPPLKEELCSSIKLIYPKKENNYLYRNFKKFLRIEPINQVISDSNFDYVLLNTILSISYFKLLKNKGKKIILYVHETEQMLRLISEDSLKYIIEDIDFILCSSNYIKNYFNLLGVKSNIGVLYPSLDFSKFNLPIKNRFNREQLGFYKNDFVWGMSGDITINKNPIMFIQAAERISKKMSNVKFLWIGASDNNVYGIYLNNYINNIGLEKVVKFIGKKGHDYYEYINEIDGFLLTSISESYSLVANESVCFNKHVVSFPCGGVIEAVSNDNLSITNNFSVDELVILMMKRMSEPKNNLRKDDLEFLFKNEKNNIGKKFITILNSI